MYGGTLFFEMKNVPEQDLKGCPFSYFMINPSFALSFTNMLLADIDEIPLSFLGNIDKMMGQT